MTEKMCDHTSVGVVLFREGDLLLIDRRLGEQGLAAPAGHVDDHGNQEDSEEFRYQAAGRAELYEETGLTASSMRLIYKGWKDNPCRRLGGNRHYWRVYLAEAFGDLDLSERETRGHLWCSRGQMEKLLRGEAAVTGDGGDALLEPVWKDLFESIRILLLFPD